MSTNHFKLISGTSAPAMIDREDHMPFSREYLAKMVNLDTKSVDSMYVRVYLSGFKDN